MSGGYESIATNLRRHRQERGWSQAHLARAAGLSRSAYQHIEAGEATPHPRTLQAVARALGVGVQELLTPVPALRHVRFRSRRRLASREQVLATVARRLADLNSLEALLGLRGGLALGTPLLPLEPAGPERALSAAAQVRARLGLQEDRPIAHLGSLLEAHGMKLLLLDVPVEGFFGLSVAAEDGGPAIVLNTWERIPAERQLFTAAHELGHLVLHLEAYDVAQGREEASQELEADTFAAHFLMPEPLFQREWERGEGLPFVERVLATKHALRVSYKAVLYRLASRLPEGARLYARFQAGWRQRTGRTLSRTEEPEPLPRGVLHPAGARGADRLSWLVQQALVRREISLSRAAEVLGCSLDVLREQVAAWEEG